MKIKCLPPNEIKSLINSKIKAFRLGVIFILIGYFLLAYFSLYHSLIALLRSLSFFLIFLIIQLVLSVQIYNFRKQLHNLVRYQSIVKLMSENMIFFKLTLAIVLFSVIISFRTSILIWNIFTNNSKGPNIINLTMNTLLTVLEVSILFLMTFFNKTLEVIDFLVSVYLDKYYVMN